MKKLFMVIEIIIICIIVQAFVLTKNFLVGIPILLVYLAFILYKSKPAIYAIKGNKAFENGDYKKAINYYEVACNSFYCSDTIKIRYAYIALQANELSLCKDVLDIIPSNPLKDPKFSSYKITEALLTWKSGNTQKAIEICKKANLKSKSTLLYETLGCLLLLDKRYYEALNYNREAYEQDKNNPVILDNLAQSYYFLGYYEKANEIYTQLLTSTEFKITFSEPYYYNGLNLEKLGNKSDCIDSLKEALKRKTSFVSDLTPETINNTLSKM